MPRETEEITAQDIQVGDEIKFLTADGKVHHFTVALLPRSEIHILPKGVARKAENLFTLSPTDSVTRYTKREEQQARARAVGGFTAERLRAERLRSFPEDAEDK